MPTRAPVHGARPRGEPRPRRFDDRLSARQRGYDWTWEKFAKAWLAEHPLCVECERKGETTEAVLVDHIVKLTLAPERRLDPTNVQGLCRCCHAVKTARGD